MLDDQAALTGFDGTLRLFPLPNLVLLPHVLQGLHIFEPRYRQMIEDALASDSLLTLVLLKPGWDENYDDRPEIESAACLCRILQHELLPDGRYNLRVRGLSRVQIIEELPIDKLYRLARGELVPDVIPAELSRLKELRRRVAEAVLPRFESNGPAHQHLHELFLGETPLGNLVDMLAYALPIPLELKQQLLADPHVDTRAEALARALHVIKPPANRQFPPDFSSN